MCMQYNGVFLGVGCFGFFFVVQTAIYKYTNPPFWKIQTFKFTSKITKIRQNHKSPPTPPTPHPHPTPRRKNYPLEILFWIRA